MKKIELIVHVGMGKTGTSSIQKALEESKVQLKNAKAKYLGYDLNYCKGPKLTELCFKPGEIDDKNHAKLRKILLKTLEHYEGKYDKLIISNERLYHRDQYISLFKSIEDLDYKVAIITYIRRPDLWARSAHAQWGIKHKTTAGIVKTFNEWAIDRKLLYGKHLEVWQDSFPNNFIVRNYEVIDDVVADFFEIIGSSYGEVVASNETVSNEQLILWALYNSRFDESVLPDKFTSFMESMGLSNKPSLDLANLLPSQHDLEEKYGVCEDEIQRINAIFEKYGESKFDEAPPKLKNEGVDHLRLIQHLTEMVYSMDARIKELEKG